jgi:NAD(P)H-flavin reductase
MSPQSRICKLIEKEYVTENTFRLHFEWEAGAEPHPGQFFMLKPQRAAVFLPRPLSVLGRRPGTVSFLAAVRGTGTEALCGMSAGDEAGLLGPLGNRFADFLPERRLAPSRIALVGGGVGIAPLLFFADEIRREETNFTLEFYAGFKKGFTRMEEQHGALGEALLNAEKLIIVSEDGVAPQDSGMPMMAPKGFVSDYFRGDGFSAVFCCGPIPMMRRIAEICKEKNVPCSISMEKKMACGVGACLGCAIKTHNGVKRCCADGPVFNAEEIFF